LEGAEGEDAVNDEPVREYSSHEGEGFREKVLRKLDQIQDEQGEAMADITKLNEEVSGLSTAVEAVVTEIAELKAGSNPAEVETLKTELAAETAKVTELQKQVEEGGVPSQAQVDALATTVEGDKAKLEAAKA
jgi:chromosome segregation ATPase